MKKETLGITSAVVSGGLLIAWAITAGVTAGGQNSRNRRRQERDSILRPILGDGAVAQAQVQDAVDDGTITPETGMALNQGIISLSKTPKYDADLIRNAAASGLTKKVAFSNPKIVRNSNWQTPAV